MKVSQRTHRMGGFVPRTTVVTILWMIQVATGGSDSDTGSTALRLDQMGSVPHPLATLSAEEIARAVAEIEAAVRGDVLIVDCHGNYDYETIQEAIDAVSDGDTVVVLPNTCTPEGVYFENIEFLGKGITVQSVFPDNPDIVAATIIDGDHNGSVVTFENGEGADSVLDGLTITHGSATRGGGIFCVSSSPTINNCVVTANTAMWDGGGMANFQCSPILANCTFSGNEASADGGGIASLQSSPMLTDCTFSGNEASADGGGIANFQSSPMLTDCTFSGNSADAGSGMYNEYDSSPTLIDCTFTRNEALADGGGMANFQSSPMLTNCTFRRNLADVGAGVYNEIRQ